MKKLDTKTEISAGLAFVQAAAAAMPRTLGDRDRINAMDKAMALAVETRFAFGLDDAVALKRLGIETCVGVFRPLYQGFYRQACLAGGTYPRMWEKAHSMRPWLAEKAVYVDYRLNRPAEYSGRVCPGIAVQLPQSFMVETKDLATTQDGFQVWWVTEFSAETINLCRYETGTASHARERAFTKASGAPARRRQVGREEWALLQKSMAPASESAAPEKETISAREAEPLAA